VDRDATPALLHAAGHPLRWRLLRALAAGDQPVHALTASVGAPQNLVSYHLGQLRRAELVTTRRSSADARDTFYRLDLTRYATLLAETGGALHSALRLVPPALPRSPRRRRRARVLFLCTGNSSRSQLAEALLRHRSAGSVIVKSAGSRPKPVHPYAIAVMAEYGIDLSRARSKHLDQFTAAAVPFDVVISLCDKVREVCPEFPGRPRVVHWSTPDPALDPDGYPAFQRVATDLDDRISYLRYELTARDPEEAP
jgi:protein-tyrosine-phosphatase